MKFQKNFIKIREQNDIRALIEKNDIKKSFSIKVVVKYICRMIDTENKVLEKLMEIFYDEYLAAIYLKCSIGGAYEKII